MLSTWRGRSPAPGGSGNKGRRDLVAVSGNDQFPDTLLNKLEAGTGITIEKKASTDGENEVINIIATGSSTPGSYTFDDEWIQNDGLDEIQHIGPSTEDEAYDILTSAEEDSGNPGTLKINFAPISVDARGHVRQLNTESSVSVDLTSFTGIGGGGEGWHCTAWVSITIDNTTGDILTLDTRDWRGKVCGLHTYSTGSGVNPFVSSSSPNAKIFFVVAGDASARIVENPANGELLVDGTDGGKLKFKVTAANPPAQEYLFHFWTRDTALSTATPVPEA
jgi:hypothetical protein